MKYFSVHSGTHEISIDLPPDHGTACQLECLFCGKAYHHNMHVHADQSARTIKTIIQEYEHILAGHKARIINLQGQDILEFQGIIDLLKISAEHQRHVNIFTPGLKLADPHFVQKILPYTPSISMTILSLKKKAYEHMTGSPQAYALIFRALDNLKMNGLNFSLSVVLTKMNIVECSDIIEHLKDRYNPSEIVLRLFNPDIRSLPDSYYHLLPRYEQVSDQLKRIATVMGEMAPRIVLNNMPLCMLPLEDLAPLKFSLTHDTNLLPEQIPFCDQCPQRKQCLRIPEPYLSLYPFHPSNKRTIQHRMKLLQEQRPHR